MIYNNVLLTVKNESDIETVAELLQEQCRLSREEPGCERFEVYQSQNNRSLFILVEQWESAEHLDAHREAKSSQTIYKPKVIPLVDRVPHPSDRVI
jgi:quinol monooxygenase YgiN